MAYRLEANENISTGIQRVMRERIHEVLDDLTQPGKDRDKGVHNARKNFKRLRAALRLIRGEVGEAFYRRENIRFRDAARQLASARDSWVMVETLDKVVADYDHILHPHAFAGVRQNLMAQYKKVKKGDSGSAIPEVVAHLLRSKIEKPPIQRETFSVFREGLQRIYQQGQKAMTQAYTQPTPETFHEWRKRVKYLWYQIEILAALWPNILENLADELHTLSEYLGDDHDLAVLRRTVLENPGGFSEEKELLLLVMLIDQKRLALQAAARPLGERIYSDTPKAFTYRLKSYWKAWLAEDQSRQTELIHALEKVSPPSLFSVNGLLTTGEMAARLDLPIPKVRALIHTNKLPAEKVGNIWVIKVGDSPPETSQTTSLDGEDRLLSTREAAEFSGITSDMVRKLISSGELPATKAGRNWLIKQGDVERVVAVSVP
jgi:excisionase family DNA binding protein